ncbi:ABC transporter ATP-binding protein [Schauerella aestuarii]|uniref:ABC transporter ATP-binding protein n=1 Tax=Schauerella aestuarii TaxID=2511204 RepID=UPI001371BDD4|nr:ABC transporter ATP-binding protein [Achromobacter aestuarii]MYZ42520.1 ATP-binding cassette domain-containing protein [Achromobacter aestuarii]
MTSIPFPCLSLRNVACARLVCSSLDIGHGQCVAITGSSGSGKTLLLRQIADLDEGTGQIELDGVDRAMITAPDWRKKVIYCPAEVGWWSDAICDHFPNRDAALEMAASLGLMHGWIDASVHQLSSGERQRAGLLRSLLRRPQVLLLDEPTSALDEKTTLKVEDVLRDQMQDGIALMVVTHDDAQARRLADCAYRVHKGKVTLAWN